MITTDMNHNNTSLDSTHPSRALTVVALCLSLSPLCLANRYAALDAYACFLLYERITALADPIVRKPEELVVGDSVRLYTRGGNECVGEGIVHKYTEEKWGTTGILVNPSRSTRRRSKRWVVSLRKTEVGRASLLYQDSGEEPGCPIRLQMKDKLGSLVLWDECRMRKAPHVPHATPIVGGGAASADVGATAGGASQSQTPETDGGDGARYVSPSEAFFRGEREGIEALSAAGAIFMGVGNDSEGETGEEQPVGTSVDRYGCDGDGGASGDGRGWLPSVAVEPQLIVVDDDGDEHSWKTEADTLLQVIQNVGRIKVV